MKKVFTILSLWLFWGFAIGTFILLGPLRKTVDYARNHQWSGQKENLVVFGLIALLIVLSFGIAYLSSKFILSSSNKYQKGSIIAIPLLAAVFSLTILLNPKYVNGREQNDVANGFTIGSYPTLEKMQELKDQGFTTIVSLLHPAVIPFEPKLLAEEEENAIKAGIKLVNIPFLPWISENETAIEKLRKLVRNAKGKYYVHCYLGKDRVNVAKLIILDESPLKVEGIDTKARSLNSLKAFERGKIYQLDKDVFFTPMPTKEEYFGFIIAGGYKQIVALKNLQKPGANEGIQIEQAWLSPYKIKFKVFDIGKNITEEEMRKIADSVKLMPKPLIVHTFKSDQPEAQLFIKTYK